MTDHEIFQQLISEYIDGTISQENQERLFQHTKECQDCARLLEDYIQISKIMADDVDPPEELLTGVMEGVREINAKRRAEERSRFKKQGVKWLAIAACAALVLIPCSKLLFGGAGLGDAQDAELQAAVPYEAMYDDSAESSPEEREASEPQEATGGANSLPGQSQMDAADSHPAQSDGAAGSTYLPENSTQDTLPTVDEVAQGYYAVVYAQSEPVGLKEDSSRLTVDFAGGYKGVQITLQELSAYEGADGFDVTYINSESDSAILVWQG